MTNLSPILLEWARRGMTWAEAILVKTQHSSPLPPGARLYVNEQGETQGAISMGCVENDVREHLLHVLKSGAPRRVHYGAANEFSYEVGLSCGGEMDILLRVQPHDETWQALAERKPEQAAILLTCISPTNGRQRICFPDGSGVGTLGNAILDQQAAIELSSLWESEGYANLKLGDSEIFAEYLGAPPTLAIVGASPIAIALCRMAAGIGFRVMVVDPRTVFARADLFPDATRVIHQWPEEGLAAAGISDRWFVAVLAHDAKLDVPALVAALRHRCRYIGLLGSKVTQEKRRAQLVEQGFSPTELDAIHGPIGLRVGALEPAEIAVSILAELIECRRRG